MQSDFGFDLIRFRKYFSVCMGPIKMSPLYNIVADSEFLSVLPFFGLPLNPRKLLPSRHHMGFSFSSTCPWAPSFWRTGEFRAIIIIIMGFMRCHLWLPRGVSLSDSDGCTTSRKLVVNKPCYWLKQSTCFVLANSSCRKLVVNNMFDYKSKGQTGNGVWLLSVHPNLKTRCGIFCSSMDKAIFSSC